MKKFHAVVLIAVLLLAGSVTGCSRLNSLLGLNPTPAHKVKATHTPPAGGAATPAPGLTPTPTTQSYAPEMFMAA